MRHSILASVTAWVIAQDGFDFEKKLKSRTLLATIVSNPYKFPVHIGTPVSLPLHVPRRWCDFGYRSFGCQIGPVRLAATYMTLRQCALCFGHQVTGKPDDLMPFMNGLPHDLKAFDAVHGVNRLLVSRASTPAPKVARRLRRKASSDEDSECSDGDEDARALEVSCENAATRANALYCERLLTKKERKAARDLDGVDVASDEDEDEPACRLRYVPSPNSIYHAECPVHGGSQPIPLSLRVNVDGLLVSIRRSLFDLTHPRFGARARVLSHHNAVGGMLDAVAGLLDRPVAPGPERVTASARSRVRFE